MNRKDRRGNKTTYLSGNTGIRLICEAVAVELLFYAMLAIFRSAFGWQLPIRALGKLQVAMLVSLVLFIVGVSATGKYQRVPRRSFEDVELASGRNKKSSGTADDCEQVVKVNYRYKINWELGALIKLIIKEAMHIIRA